MNISIKLEKDVFVIIVTFNGMQWLPKCLLSVYNSDFPLKVVVVDNNSTDNTLSFIKDKYPQIYLVESKKNLGFGKANNIGIKLAIENGADYIYLLNQDAYLENDTIKKLIHLHTLNPEYGVLSPMQMNGIGSDLDFSFKKGLNLKNCRQYKIDSLYKKKAIGNIYEINFVMAAHWLISKECIKKVGFFDHIFPHYGEDIDYLNRVKYHGFKTGICPKAIGYHDREFRKKEVLKEIRILYLSALSQATNINTNFLVSCAKIIKSIIVYFFKNNFFQLRLSVIKEHYKGFLYLIKRYEQIQKSRKKNKIPNREFII